MTKRKTLWTWGMPTPDLGRNWRHDGSVYYVDVTDEYVPAEQLRGAVEALRDIVTETHAQNSAESRADDAARMRRIAVDALSRFGGQ
jgi:hypothetical protein